MGHSDGRRSGKYVVVITAEDLQTQVPLIINDVILALGIWTCLRPAKVIARLANRRVGADYIYVIPIHSISRFLDNCILRLIPETSVTIKKEK